MSVTASITVSDEVVKHYEEQIAKKLFFLRLVGLCREFGPKRSLIFTYLLRLRPKPIIRNLQVVFESELHDFRIQMSNLQFDLLSDGQSDQNIEQKLEIIYVDFRVSLLRKLGDHELIPRRFVRCLK